MLEFFRRYQKFFYIVITTVIIISFSFFGTYGTLTKGGGEDKAAFTAIDGRSIPRSELERMVVFLQTDRDDKRNLGGLWGPNFLNDGVVAHDFLETGIAAQLLSSFQTDIASDLEQRQQRERTFRPYQHPDAGFLSAELAWSYFVPDLKGAYDRLRQQEDASSPDAIAARIDLYLQERKFPASSLRQVLRYQERQYEWLRNDPRLVHEDLSLFRYHTVDDWFGTRFMHLVAQFIMNGATLATERGYSVSADEALVELMRINDRRFQEIAQNPDLEVT
ncbi:MAG: SurA N-terminal domain-containing protein, partial [Chlamydiia bacterium]|nr:SurA N-terminal domain-containing protein [Chlamydiia bacterium]